MYTPSSRPWNSWLKRALSVHDLGVVLQQLRHQEEAEHAALAVHAEGTPSASAAAWRPSTSERWRPTGPRRSRACGSRAASPGRRPWPPGCRQRAAWYTPPSGPVFHDGALAAEGRQRHAAADDLAQYREVGREAGDGLGIDALRAAQRHAEARHHLVEHQQRAVLRAQLAAAA